MTSSAKARHRKASRPLTPLSTAGPAARRGLAVAASSGLAITMIASAANAAGDDANVGESAGALSESGVDALANGAREAVTTNAPISISSEVSAAPEVTADATSEVTAEAPAPQPAPQETAAQAPTTEPAAQQAPAEEPTEAAPAEASESAPAPSSSAAGSIAATAMQYVGSPYVYGAGGPSAFDCSGLVQYVYGQFGISVPHSSGGIRSAGTVVDASAAQPGDVIWWSGHVAIYTGDGMMVSADSPGQGVQYRAVDAGGTFLRF